MTGGRALAITVQHMRLKAEQGDAETQYRLGLLHDKNNEKINSHDILGGGFFFHGTMPRL